MFASKWRFAAILAAVIGVFSLGAIGQNSAFQGAPAPAAKKVPKEMLEKRRDAAKQLWKISFALRQGAFKGQGRFNGQLSDLWVWSERWLDAELALYDKKEDRSAALKGHVDRTRQIEQLAKANVQFAAGTSTSVIAATYERINAEIRYFEETGKTPPPTEGIKPDNELPKPQEAKDDK
jgi:hypothetical protein